jgi:DNA-binding CsgD family transcriptional regulator
MRRRSEPMPVLLDREAERATLDALLTDLRSGRGRVLVVRGEAGVGKSALLEYVAGAADMRVIRAAGVESEMELAFASLHQLCVPLLDRVEGLPGPQRDALGVAFGLRPGAAADRFLVALAVLTLLAEVAEERPLLCVVDDAQWLDKASAQALAFAARRLLAEPVGLIFAAREPGEEFRGLADLEVRGLSDQDARTLLRSAVRFRLDDRVRDRIVAETKGNPLALLELPRGLSPAQLAGGFGTRAIPARIMEGFRRRLAELPADTRSLLLIAAAEPAGDPVLVWRAAERLGIPPSAADTAQADRLLQIGMRVQFRHPLVRSAVYSAALPQERRAAHRAPADATDRDRDPGRRAWHLAAAADGPDEEVAAELERSAGRAQARGGMAAAAAVFAGYLAGAGDLLEVSRAAQALPPPAHPPRPVDLLLDGLALMITDGPTAAAPVLRQATTAFASADIPVQESLQWGWLVRVADRALWDEDGRRLTVRQVQLARDVGALDQLPILLNMMAMDAVWSGDFTAAASLVAEAAAVCEATGSRLAPFAAVMLASFRGREGEAAALIKAAIEEGASAGQGVAVTYAQWVAAILHNGLGRYADALAAARQASEHQHPYVSAWTLPELIEAAAHTGDLRTAREALDLLAERTRAGGTEEGRGVQARCRALLSEGQAADQSYREAVGLLSRTGFRPELARAHLLYGEWLRREDRRDDARTELHTAHGMFAAIGMEAFAERARRELQAAGETVRTRAGGAHDQLTPQEAQIARLAREGLSNPEIGAQLFLSPRTVEYHLAKVFSKLGITSRRQLRQALP